MIKDKDIVEKLHIFEAPQVDCKRHEFWHRCPELLPNEVTLFLVDRNMKKQKYYFEVLLLKSN